MIAEPNQDPMSVEEYLALDRSSQNARLEYIDGVVTMLAGGTSNHSRISVNLINQLYMALEEKPCRVFNSDMKVRVSPTRYVYPDVFVSCDADDLERGDSDIIQHACMVIEVLSPTTEVYDRIKKFSYYRDCPTIQEIALISTQEIAVDLYRRANEKLWSLHLFRTDDKVDLRSINVSMPIATIYKYVTFDK
ncbi:MAG: Uma2 family endonuclease [Ktedonobacteraceae bacterium]